MQKLLKQTFSHHFHPHPWNLNLHAIEVIKGFHKERGFSEAVAQRLAISQRQSSAGVYESKWKVFGEWCHVKQLILSRQLSNSSWFPHLPVEEKKLAISSLQGYRSCISKVFLARGIDISHDRDLNMQVKKILYRSPCATQGSAKMGSHGSSEASYEASLEPMNMASLADMTRKLAFLLTLASAKRNSEVRAFSADVRFGQDCSQWSIGLQGCCTLPASCRFCQKMFGQKRQTRVNQHPNNKFRRLLCAFIGDTRVIYPSRQCQGGSDIWSHKAYSEGQDEDIPHLTHTNFQARELRAFASSLAFHPTIP